MQFSYVHHSELHLAHHQGLSQHVHAHKVIQKVKYSPSGGDVYVTTQFSTWPVSKPVAHFKTSLPILKPVDPIPS